MNANKEIHAEGYATAAIIYDGTETPVTVYPADRLIKIVIHSGDSRPLILTYDDRRLVSQ